MGRERNQKSGLIKLIKYESVLIAIKEFCKFSHKKLQLPRRSSHNRGDKPTRIVDKASYQIDIKQRQNNKSI